MAITVQDFFKRFPDDDACLAHLMKARYGDNPTCPKCRRDAKFYRLSNHPAYSCEWCGHHIHPMVGTPFHRSHTPLQKWFYAMYMFTTTRNGVAAKELQRQLGLPYKTAWRMGHEIRKYMAKVDGDDGLSGHIEADEAYIGGRRAGAKQGFTGRAAKGKAIVFGMVERGGDIITRVVPNASANTMLPHIIAKVEPGSTISTDEWPPYKRLRFYPYEHLVVKHAAKQWVIGKAHTNTIEGFWGQLKRSIRGTHVWVSGKHLPKYLGEFEFRFNMRKSPELMFPHLLRSF